MNELIQAGLGVAGVKSISRFSVIGEANGDVRTFAVDHLGLDRARDVVQGGSVGGCMASIQDKDDSSSSGRG